MVAAFDFPEPAFANFPSVLPPLSGLFSGAFRRIVETDVEGFEFHAFTSERVPLAAPFGQFVRGGGRPVGQHGADGEEPGDPGKG